VEEKSGGEERRGERGGEKGIELAVMGNRIRFTGA
jgi:hypothetical protein